MEAATPFGMHPALVVFLAALLTAVATGLGALPFIFIRRGSPRVLAYANAGAAGLMLGASFGLLAEGATDGPWQTFTGALIGIVFILVTQRILGHSHPEVGDIRGAGARQALLILVVMTVHSMAEGVAVGVAFGGGASLAAAITIAIAIHNIPEGLAISAVLRPRGASVLACAGWSIFSSLPQPILAVPAFIFVEQFRQALPFGLGFAAGAMVFMVLVELLPEAYEQTTGRGIALVTTGSLVGMLVLQRFL
jgi:zinc transporter, ZIP family